LAPTTFAGKLDPILGGQNHEDAALAVILSSPMNYRPWNADMVAIIAIILFLVVFFSVK
jgi:hypothetical protein